MTLCIIFFFLQWTFEKKILRTYCNQRFRPWYHIMKVIFAYYVNFTCFSRDYSLKLRLTHTICNVNGTFTTLMLILPCRKSLSLGKQNIVSIDLWYLQASLGVSKPQKRAIQTVNVLICTVQLNQTSRPVQVFRFRVVSKLFAPPNLDARHTITCPVSSARDTRPFVCPHKHAM